MLKYLPWKQRKEEESIQFFMACFVFQYFCFQIVQSGHTLCFYALQKLGSSTHYLSLLNETYTLLTSIFYSAAGISVSHNSHPYFFQRFSVAPMQALDLQGCCCFGDSPSASL